jgi:ribosomal protein S27AE
MNNQINASHEWVRIFYNDLQELIDTTFPKSCPKCGKVYDTKLAFLSETIPVKDHMLEDRSGLFHMHTDPESTSVGLFRNCSCGTTLMADFRDRRDNSEGGRMRREHFDTLLDRLQEKGVTASDSRRELLKVLHGETSSLIDDLLDDVKLA